MATALAWKNVKVKMQSTLAVARTITAVTKANPAVATCTGHGLVTGDIVLVTAEGMYQIDKRVFKVTRVDDDTFNLDGENSTDYDTFVSGKVAEVTLDTNIITATSINVTGGEFDKIDTTTIHSNVKSEMPGMATATSYEMTHIWDTSDPALIALKAASDKQQTRVFQFLIGESTIFISGIPGCTLNPGGQGGQLITTSTTISVQGFPTYY